MYEGIPPEAERSLNCQIHIKDQDIFYLFQCTYRVLLLGDKYRLSYIHHNFKYNCNENSKTDKRKKDKTYNIIDGKKSKQQRDL